MKWLIGVLLFLPACNIAQVLPDLMCAMNRTGSIFQYKKCPRNMNGNTPLCIYLVIPSTKDSPRQEIYDCVIAEKLEQHADNCRTHREYYIPHTSVTIRDKTMEGAVICCMDDYCNEIEEPVVSLVRLVEEQAWAAAAKGAFPVLVILMVLLHSAAPLLWSQVERRQNSSRRRSEKAQVLPESTSPFDIKEVPRPLSVAPTFEKVKRMYDIIRSVGSQKLLNNNLQDDSFEEHSLFLYQEIDVVQRDNTEVRKVRRMFPTKLTDLAQRMIEHGPFEFPFRADEVGFTFDAAGQLLAAEPTLLELPGDIYIYGNLEGSFGDLFRWFQLNGWPPKKRVLFLGGLTSPDNKYSLETLTLVFALKRTCPNHVFIIRGAAETEILSLKGRFPRRIERALVEVIHKACSNLPLAALVLGKVLCVHGGIPLGLTSLKQIKRIDRPLRKIDKYTVEADLIFNVAGDQNTTVPGSRGHLFDGTSSEMKETLGSLNIDMMIRARNPITQGYQLLGPMTMTLWSKVGPHNNAACVYITRKFGVKITKMARFGTFTDQQLEWYRSELAKVEAEYRKAHGKGARNKKKTTFTKKAPEASK